MKLKANFNEKNTNIKASFGETYVVGSGGSCNVVIDTTLSTEGAAADAKAVGDALAEKQDIERMTVSVPLEFTDGWIYINGNKYDSSLWRISQEIPVFEGEEVYAYANLAGNNGANILLFFDAAGNAIQGYTSNDCTKITGTNYGHEITVTAPTASAYVIMSSFINAASRQPIMRIEKTAISVLNGQIAATNAEVSKVKNEVDLIKNTSAPDMKVLVIGDSISTGASSVSTSGGASYGAYNKWVDALIAEGFFTSGKVRNDSFLGTGFVRRMKPSDVGGTTNENNFVDRIQAVTDASTYDLVILFGGVNDFLGEDKSTDTYYGGVPLDVFKPAVDSFFSHLVNNFTQARLVVLLPTKCWKDTNSIGVKFTDYVDYIAEVAKSYSLPTLDLTNGSGFCPTNDAFNTMWCNASDRLHPNNAYQVKYLAPMIKKFLMGLI